MGEITFNIKEYKAKWQKEHPKARIPIDVTFEEKERIVKVLKKAGLNCKEAFLQKIDELEKTQK